MIVVTELRTCISDDEYAGCHSDEHRETGGLIMITHRSTKLIGSTLGFVTGGAIAAVGFIYLIQNSLLKLF